MVVAGDFVHVYDTFGYAERTVNVVDKSKAKKMEDIAGRMRDVDNILRSNRKLRYLLESNVKVRRSYFFTGTFSRELTDWNELNVEWKRFVRVLRRHFPDVSYVCVPEIQSGRERKTGAAVWHVHAVLIGMPSEYRMREIYGKREGKYDWQNFVCSIWRDVCGSGRAEVTAVRDKYAVSRYISKYVTKELARRVPFGKKCYFSGGDLRRPDEFGFKAHIDENGMIDNNGDFSFVLPDVPEYQSEYYAPFYGKIVYRKFYRCPIPVKRLDQYRL